MWTSIVPDGLMFTVSSSVFTNSTGQESGIMPILQMRILRLRKITVPKKHNYKV